MNSNLDFKDLIGSEVKMFFGNKMSATNINGHLVYEFREGVSILTPFENKIESAFNFSGKITELSNLEDSFDLLVKKEMIDVVGYTEKCMLQWRTKLSSNFLKVIGVDVYGMKVDSITEPEIFALYFHCEEKEEFLIFFDFPADGLSLSFDREFIAKFFKSDPMGKKCFLMKSLRSQV